MINATCPNCKRALRIADQYVGKTVKCAYCQTQFVAQNATGSRPAMPASGSKPVMPAVPNPNVFEEETIAGPPPGYRPGPPAYPAPPAPAPYPGVFDEATVLGPAPGSATVRRSGATPSNPSGSHPSLRVPAVPQEPLPFDGPPPLPPRRRQAVGGTFQFGSLIVCIFSLAVIAGSLTGIVTLLRAKSDQGHAAGATGPAEMWAVITIETGGSRFLAIQVTPTSESYDFTKVDTAQKDIKFDPDKVGAALYRESTMAELESALQLFLAIAKDKEVPSDHLFVVANRGVVEVSKTDEKLVDKAKDRLSSVVRKVLDQPLAFISVDDEAKYGVLGIIPPRDRDDSASFDIGSTFVKMGFNSSRGMVETAKFDGTKAFISRVEPNAKKAPLGLPEFNREAVRIRSFDFLPALTKTFDEKPAFRNRPKYHIMGGAAWVVSTIEHPKDPEKNHRVSLTSNEIDDYINLIKDCKNFDDVKEDALSRARTPADRKWAEAQLKDIGDKLDMKFLIASGHMLKMFSDACAWRSGKEVQFFTDGLYAWPLGYVLVKSGHEPKPR